MNKKFIVPIVLGVMFIAGVLAVGIWYANINVTATVSEALSTTTTDVSVSGVSGEIVTKTFNITNAANRALNTELTWAEVTKTGGVIYTTDMPKTVALVPGLNTISVVFTYNTTSPLGTVAGTVTLTRVA